ncbi:MAG: VOC family protein [Desulfobacteraceae bacterium]|nr:VOC family protein [Desulfobacteraceae bacterium]
MSIKVHHISIFISDMERTKFLFQDILGFKLVWHIPMAKGKKISALLGIPDLECELVYLTSPDNDVAIELSRLINPIIKTSKVLFGNPGTIGLSLDVQDLDKLHKRLNKEGWHPLSPCLELQSPEGDKIRAFCVRIENCMTLELIEKTNTLIGKQKVF